MDGPVVFVITEFECFSSVKELPEKSVIIIFVSECHHVFNDAMSFVKMVSLTDMRSEYKIILLKRPFRPKMCLLFIHIEKNLAIYLYLISYIKQKKKYC